MLASPDTSAADLLATYLSLQDFEVAIAHDAREAMRTAQRFRPTLAVCDLHGLGADGAALAKALRADRRRRYAVALTGRPDADLGGHRHLFEACFSQPLDLDDFVNRLELLASLALRVDSQHDLAARFAGPAAPVRASRSIG